MVLVRRATLYARGKCTQEGKCTRYDSPRPSRDATIVKIYRCFRRGGSRHKSANHASIARSAKCCWVEHEMSQPGHAHKNHRYAGSRAP